MSHVYMSQTKGNLKKFCLFLKKNVLVLYVNLKAYVILSIKWDILPDVFEI